MLSPTDENGNVSSTAYSGTNYTNYFWRPYSTADQNGTLWCSRWRRMEVGVEEMEVGVEVEAEAADLLQTRTRFSPPGPGRPELRYGTAISTKRLP